MELPEKTKVKERFMKKLILATSNQHKVKEIKRIFDDYELITLKDLGFENEIIEDGTTFEENALIKARAILSWLKTNNMPIHPILAEDSGLCVNAINGEPGINSARYSGGDSEANRQLLLSKLKDTSDRSAFFQCSMILMFEDGSYKSEVGKCFGEITKEKIGDESFGYDCIFLSKDLNKVFVLATADEKDTVSHRAVALTKIKKHLL